MLLRNSGLLMDLQLKYAVVLITGGAKGIGGAITRACAEEGAIPVIIDRDAEAGKKIEQELTARKIQCKWIGVDLTSSDSCRAAVEETARGFGRIYALVNNA